MANRLRGDFINGIAVSITAGNPATLVLSSGLGLSIPSGSYLPIVLNPPPYVQVSGSNYLSEIVWTSGIYAMGATSFTVLRGQENTVSIGAQANIPYAAGPTTQDFGIINWQNNGDFPVPSVPGEFLVSTSGGASIPSWTFGYLVPSGGMNGQLVSISGGVPVPTSIISSGVSLEGLTVSGYQVYGYLPNSTISGSQIVGNVTNVSGYYPFINISGYQVYGYLPNSTISGSQVVGEVNAAQVSGTLVNITSVSGAYIYGTMVSGTVNDSVITNSTVSGNFLVNNTIINTTFSGSILNNAVITSPIENVNIVNQGLSGTITVYNNLTSINYYTVASSGNFVVNATYNGGTISGSLAAGQSLSFVLLNTNGPTAYVLSGFMIDGTPQAMHWMGGTAPTQGNPSATDYYSFSIIKTNNSPTYWVSVGLTKFI